MASTSEVGHAKNVANFQDLIAFVNGYGATYNPSKDGLKLPQLETLHTKAKDSLSTVTAKTTEYNDSVNNRIEAFKDLRSLSTRLINALDATDASDQKMKDAKVFNRKMQGQRASKVKTPLNPNDPPPNTISTSQQSYDQLIQHFQGLISVLESERSYSPNETELQISTLEAKAQDLDAKNDKVATAYTEISNARLARNNKLYKEDVGLVPTAGEVKKYVKSVFGASSPEFAQIKGIKFKNEK